MSNYTAENIRTIDELIDHIRENIGMYIGESSTPIHLFEECFTNSIDEAIAQYAKNIHIDIDTENNIYSIYDNGRGIPINNDVPIQISTKFSGAKFQGSKTAYNVVSGKHGVGLVVVNALSSNYEIEIYRDNKYGLFQFENGKLANRTVRKHTKEKSFSTKVSFKPDPKFFDSEIIPIDEIRNRCLTASVELPHCNISLDVSGDETEHITYDKMDYFNNYCVRQDDDLNEAIHLRSSDKNESFEAIFSWSNNGPVSPQILSSVNVLPVEDGGTHINLFSDIIKEVLVEKSKKGNYRFQPSDCLVRLRAYLSLYLVQPEFGAQSKDKLTNRKNYFNVLYKKLKKEFDRYLTNNPELLNHLLDQFDTYRRSLDSKKLRSNASSNRASTKLTKLKDCQRRDGELFIVEGDSAAGTVIDMRNPDIHAILPLKGKIPSITNKQEEIIKNEEISDLISAIGTGYGPEFDINNIRYSKIIITVDADFDGGHIASLLMAMFAVLSPGIIQNGYLYLARTPLRAINDTKKGEFTPLWTEKAYKQAVKKKRPITYFKGLGELNSWQLEECALNPDNRNLIRIDFPNNLDEIMSYFSNVDKKRNLLDNEEVSFFNY